MSEKEIQRQSGKVLIVNCAAMSSRIVKRMFGCKTLEELQIPQMNKIQNATPLKPVFPAVTMPVQASMMTGELPQVHGCISNTRLDRRTLTHDSWEQSSFLLDKRGFWNNPDFSGKTTATVCWQFSYFNGADFCVSPAPVHGKDGTLSAIYTKPGELSSILESELGSFPLHNYWGPLTSINATGWIVKAVKSIIKKYSPDIVLSYLPYLDCVLQKMSLDDPRLEAELASFKLQLEALVEYASLSGYKIVLMSEYGITPVNQSIAINRFLRQRGFLKVTQRVGVEKIDTYESIAFAIPDHQTAGVFVSEKSNLSRVVEVLRSLKGVGSIFTRKNSPELGIWHENAAEIILASQPNAWFNYSYWESSDNIPPFAKTVDIHSKPGYDPLELFFNRETKSIETENTDLVKGSHGLIPPDTQDYGVWISNAENLLIDGEFVKATDFPDLIKQIVFPSD